MVAAVPMYGPPRFLLDFDGKDIKVKAGDPLDLDVPWEGYPTPTAEWIKDGSTPLKTVPTVKIESDEKHTQMLIPSSRRSDSGKYTINAKNDYGDATATCNVTVIDKPGPPEGPIEYPRITKSSVQLQWKPPKDTGNADITGTIFFVYHRFISLNLYFLGYTVEMIAPGSEEWVRVGDFVPGTTHIVKGLDEGKSYTFRVKAENMCGFGEPLMGAPIIVKDPFSKSYFKNLHFKIEIYLFSGVPGQPGPPEITGYDTNYVSFKWTPPRDDGGSPITGYIIEKSDKAGADWTPVNTSPVPTTDYKVPGLTEGQTYQFRVKAVNAIGEGPPSRATEPTTCRPSIGRNLKFNQRKFW